ncbi:MAG: transglutaminase domain-containing protein, partial [Calditrichaeota bacterium]
RLNVPIVIHSRNAWNGDMMMLPSFLTPEVEQVRDFVRHVALDLVEETPGMETFSRAKAIFDSLAARKIRYLPDPNIPFYRDDRVQFAEETLDAGSGDCDDLAVLYASLLESLGIHTAFVEVRDPEKELAHVYLLFNSALTSESGYLISENEKRYILREGPSGKMNIWIPVETTLLESGFAVAWNEAALAYLQEAQLRNGLADGWVKIIDHH